MSDRVIVIGAIDLGTSRTAYSYTVTGREEIFLGKGVFGDAKPKET